MILKKGIGYRVEVGDNSTEDDMRTVFAELTKTDGFMLHTVWFYGLASDVDKVGAYTVGMLSESDKGIAPTFSSPTFSQADIERLRAQ